jgi:hypothetical protein
LPVEDAVAGHAVPVSGHEEGRASAPEGGAAAQTASSADRGTMRRPPA